MKSYLNYFRPVRLMVPLISGGVFFSLLILAADIMLPRRLAVEMLYVFVILFSLWSPRKRDSIILGLYCAGFAVLGYLFSIYPVDYWTVYLNLAICLGAIGVTSFVCYRRKQAEEDVRLNEELFRTVVESAPNAMIMVRGDGTITLVNSQAEKMFGYDRSEMMGRAVEMLMPEAIRAAHSRYRSEFGNKPETRAMGRGRDLYGLRKDGTRIPIEIGLNPIKSQNGPYVLASIIDITERNQIEEERIRLQRQILEVADNERRRIGQDLHDGLGQKLLGIGFLSRALRDELSQTKPENAAEADRITQLLNEALDQTRQMARGLYAAELQANDLPTALKQLAANVKSMTRLECLFINKAPPTEYEPPVAANYYRIAQEALNNAIKHSKATRIEMTLEQQNQKQVLTIIDNGQGLSIAGGNNQGMGLQVIRYRANIIGAECQIQNYASGGVMVRCAVPLKLKSKTDED